MPTRSWRPGATGGGTQAHPREEEEEEEEEEARTVGQGRANCDDCVCLPRRGQTVALPPFQGLPRREAGLAVWIDEVQTFARTGELYAFRTLSLEDLVDVVTVGKSLQGSAALFTKAYNPRPGLIAGTYAGSTVGMAVGTRIIERLEREGYLGPEGRVAVLGGRFERRLDSFRKRMPGCIGQRSGIGAMQAFVPFDGSQQVVSAIVHRAFEEGLMVFSAGSNPTKIRMLLPVNTTDEELETGFAMLEKAMRRVADERDIPC